MQKAVLHSPEVKDDMFSKVGEPHNIEKSNLPAVLFDSVQKLLLQPQKRRSMRARCRWTGRPLRPPGEAETGPSCAAPSRASPQRMPERRGSQCSCSNAVKDFHSSLTISSRRWRNESYRQVPSRRLRKGFINRVSCSDVSESCTAKSTSRVSSKDFEN